MVIGTGQVINNRYRIVSILGEGGFGAVYRAWDLNLDKPYALKHNLDTSAEAQRQFVREATTLAALNHPNLPRVIDHLIVPGQGQFLVMDFIEGEDLDHLIHNNGPVSLEKAMKWNGEVADALTYLHNRPQPIIHRDIKPANIRITPQDQAFLVDFGLVKVYDEHLRTTIGARAVTPGYSPPEQYGQGNTDARTDVYALAATLYTVLTGLEPQESVQRIVEDRIVPVYEANTQVDPQIHYVIATAMAISPKDRYQTVGAFTGDLRKAVSENPVYVGPRADSARRPTAEHVIPEQQTNIAGGMSYSLFGAALIPALLVVIAFAVIAINKARTPVVVEVVVTRLATATPSSISQTEDSNPTPAVVQVSEISNPIVLEGEPVGPTTVFESDLLAAITATAFVMDTASPVAAAKQVPSRTAVPTLTPDPKKPPTNSGLGDTWTRPADRMIMHYVPGGRFLMKDSYGDIAHDEMVDSFWIDETEVTNAQFARFVDATGYRTSAEKLGSSNVSSFNGPWVSSPGIDWMHPRGPESDLSGLEAHPVIHVSWEDANAYCTWTDARLPSQIDWDLAAYGLRGRLYPWGDSFDGSKVNFCDANCTKGIHSGDEGYDDGFTFTAPVGSYQKGASWIGALNMAGNVSELMRDVHPDERFRFYRGGSWLSASVDVIFLGLDHLGPATASWDFLGFRCSVPSS